MRVLLAGSRSFGAAALDQLGAVASVDVVATMVPAGPDRLREAARAYGLPCYQPPVTPGLDHDPPRLEARDIARARIDAIVSAHNLAFIPTRILQATRWGGFGYHPSLLPTWRGHQSVQHSVADGDGVGGTVYWLTSGVDAGPLAMRQAVWLRDGDGASELWRRELYALGLAMLEAQCRRMLDGWTCAVPQDHGQATYAPRSGRPADPSSGANLPRPLDGLRVTSDPQALVPWAHGPRPALAFNL